MYKPIRVNKKIHQNNAVSMPQPPSGQMPTKMALTTIDNGLKYLKTEVMAVIATKYDNKKKPNVVPKNVSASNIRSSTLRE
jgi:hypothetical protein